MASPNCLRRSNDDNRRTDELRHRNPVCALRPARPCSCQTNHGRSGKRLPFPPEAAKMYNLISRCSLTLRHDLLRDFLGAMLQHEMQMILGSPIAQASRMRAAG